MLATHGAFALLQHRAANLQIALQTSREIGVGMGVLVHRYKITSDEAFDLLRLASQQSHRKLIEIARDVTETGEISLPPPRQPHAR